MSVKRKVYDKEFKVRAVRMSYETDNISRLSEELGMRVELLYRWRTEMQKDESKRFPGHGNKAMTPEDAENAKLKKLLADTEMELEILKKAIGIFSRKGGSSIGSL
jgi:transposase